jgi:hypothetical protein
LKRVLKAVRHRDGPFREFSRVLRRDGHLVISDQRGLIGDIVLPLGFQVLRCEEPRVPSPVLDDEGRTIHDGERLPPQDPNEPPYTWALHGEELARRGRPYGDDRGAASI